MIHTQALAQDQLRSLVEMTKGSNINLNVGVYDGDTFKDHRIWLRDNARLVVFLGLINYNFHLFESTKA